ncbi:MAG: NO-inducible flavohemoprotein [Pseudomonadota bacterium]
MFSAKSRAIVKSTAPLLAEKGTQITDLFYKKLFSHHPELKHVFNMANQAKGEQSRALADAVFRYATHIDELEKLGPMVSRIAHKHASLQVAPEHYPIVGKYLLEAIQNHLGLEAADSILEAWAEAYQQLAVIFVATEENIYAENENKTGGGRGFRAFRMADIRYEAQDVKSFYLEPVDGLPIATFAPGQYVGVKVKPDIEGYDEIRQYSLSNAPGENYYRITVKAEANVNEVTGKVSNFLHHAKRGDELLLQPPTGDFIVARPENDIALIAGGVGITPLLSMILQRIQSGKNTSNLTFIQCCRNAEHHIMADELRTLSNQYGFKYFVSYEAGDGADFTGYLTKDIIQQWLGGANPDIYFCGPKPFMVALNNLLGELDISEDKRFYETFGPNIRLS